MKKVAFVFPGQGSQKLAMLAELATEYPIVSQTFDHAAAALGYDLWELIQQGPQERLNQTEITQPALLACEVAVWRIWEQQGGIKPALMAGHSLGEYSALCCADVISFKDALNLVAARGRFMQEAVDIGKGAMAAIIGLSNEQVHQICQQTTNSKEIVNPANFNSVGQTVVAGHRSAVEKAVSLAKTQGAKIAKLIPVSVPAHSELMRPAAQKLRAEIASIPFNSPSIPVIHNADVRMHVEKAEIQQALVHQLYSPVRWVETVKEIARHNVETIVECGPGKVLAGLIKRINPELRTFTTETPAQFLEALEEVNDVIQG